MRKHLRHLFQVAGVDARRKSTRDLVIRLLWTWHAGEVLAAGVATTCIVVVICTAAATASSTSSLDAHSCRLICVLSLKVRILLWRPPPIVLFGELLLRVLLVIIVLLFLVGLRCSF